MTMGTVESTEEKVQVVFLGTGVSTGLPNMRGNVSILLKVGDKNVLVDCGKTFREGALRWFRKFHVRQINAVILTHGHMDAMGGMDDLRDVQKTEAPIPIYLNQETLETCRTVYPYLFPDPNRDDVVRRVAKLHWALINNFDSFEVEGLKVTPLPLFHGGEYICLGFSFGGKNPFVYLSDLHAVPDATMVTIKALGPISTLIVDALNIKGHNSHMSLPEAVNLVKELRPKQAYFVGMTCGLGLHEEVSEDLRRISEESNIPMELAYDGLSFSMETTLSRVYGDAS